MVRMNTQGLKVPINMEDFKKLPVTNGAKTATMRKKFLSDFGPRSHHHIGSIEDEEELEIDDDDELLEEQRRLRRETEEEATSVFDLVHRGRQRD